MVEDNKILGMVDDLDKAVETLAEEGINVSITGRSRVCTFQVMYRACLAFNPLLSRSLIRDG